MTTVTATMVAWPTAGILTEESSLSGVEHIMIMVWNGLLIVLVGGICSSLFPAILKAHFAGVTDGAMASVEGRCLYRGEDDDDGTSSWALDGVPMKSVSPTRSDGTGAQSPQGDSLYFDDLEELDGYDLSILKASGSKGAMELTSLDPEPAEGKPVEGGGFAHPIKLDALKVHAGKIEHMAKNKALRQGSSPPRAFPTGPTHSGSPQGRPEGARSPHEYKAAGEGFGASTSGGGGSGSGTGLQPISTGQGTAAVVGSLPTLGSTTGEGTAGIGSKGGPSVPKLSIPGVATANTMSQRLLTGGNTGKSVVSPRFLARAAAAVEARKRKKEQQEQRKREKERQEARKARKANPLSAGAYAAIFMSAIAPHLMARKQNPQVQLENGWFSLKDAFLSRFDVVQVAAADDAAPEEDDEEEEDGCEKWCLAMMEGKGTQNEQDSRSSGDRSKSCWDVEDGDLAKSSPTLNAVREVVESSYFNAFFFLLIICNNVTLVIAVNTTDTDKLDLVTTLNTAFTIFFTIEVSLRITAFQLAFLRSFLGIFDLSIVLISIAELVLDSQASALGSLRTLRMLRMAQLLKMGRMARSVTVVRVVIEALAGIVPTIVNTVGLLFLLVWVFSLLGMEMFAGKLPVGNPGLDCDFDNFGSSILAILQIITLEEWPMVSARLKEGTDWQSAMIFTFGVIFTGRLILINLLVGVMLAFFEEPDMGIHISKGALEHPVISGGGLSEDTLHMIRGTHIVQGVNQVASALSRKKENRFIKGEAPSIDTSAKVHPGGPESPNSPGGSPLPPVARIPRVPDEEEVSGFSMKEARRLQAELDYREKQNFGSSGSAAFGEGHLGWLMDPPIEFTEGEGMPHTWKGWCEKARKLDNFKLLRLYCCAFVQQWWFKPLTELVILVNCIIMAVDPRMTNHTLEGVDHFCTAALALEIFVKMNALTISVYLDRALNWLDIIVVIAAFVALADSNFMVWKCLRVLRVLRPLCLLIRSGVMLDAVTTLLKSIPAVLNVMIVSAMAGVMYITIGVQTFRGRDNGWCSDMMGTSFATCESRDDVTAYWLKPPVGRTFENIFEASLTLTQISSFAGWTDIMYYYTRHPEAAAGETVYFVTWVFIAGFVFTNLFLGVIWFTSVDVRDARYMMARLTDFQRDWIASMRHCKKMTPLVVYQKPGRTLHPNQRHFYDFITNWLVTSIIDLAICANIAAIALRHHGDQNTSGDLTCLVSMGVSGMLIVEMICKWIAFTPQMYLKEYWHQIEFVNALVGIPDIIHSLNVLNGGHSTGTDVALLRACVAFRIVRLMRPKLLQAKDIGAQSVWSSSTTSWNTLIHALSAGIKECVYLCALTAIVLYMYAVAGTVLWYDVVPPNVGSTYLWQGLSPNRNFKTFGSSFWLVFQLCTSNIWPHILADCSESSRGGDSGVAFFYFFSFKVISSILVLHLFVTFVVAHLIDAKDGHKWLVNLKHFRHFEIEWARYDPECTGFISPHLFKKLLTRLEAPMGLARPAHASAAGGEDLDLHPDEEEDISAEEEMLAMTLIKDLELLDWDGKVQFHETCFALTERMYGMHAGKTGEEMGDIPMLAAQERYEFVKAKNLGGFSAAERLATQLLIKACQKRIFVRSLQRGVMPKDLWRKLHVKHLTGSLRMREVQACEIMLRALKNFGMAGCHGEAKVSDDVWRMIPDDYELEWAPEHANWEISDEEVAEEMMKHPVGRVLNNETIMTPT